MNQDVIPLAIYREENKPIVVWFRRWIWHNGEVKRHTKFYQPSPSSLARIERVAKNMSASVNSLNSRITSYAPNPACTGRAYAPCKVCGRIDDNHLLDWRHREIARQ